MVKMARNAGLAQMRGHAAELRQEELEDERETHHQRLPCRQPLGDPFRAVANVDHLDGAAVPLQHGRQISHAEVALVLVTDQPAPPQRRRGRPIATWGRMRTLRPARCCPRDFRISA
jgi:hypothetical protein